MEGCKSHAATYILGISAYYHDSAAALIKDGHIVAAAQEERFTRIKHYSGFPGKSVKYCLEFAGIGLEDVRCIVFYDKPLLKFERLLETYLSFSPSGLKSFLKAMPVWLKEKVYLKRELRRALTEVSGLAPKQLPKLLFTGHHQSHAASAFFPSPFDRAAVLCLDGVGEWATTSAWNGDGAALEPLWQIDFPHSLGLLYSSFTYYLGFKVNSGEYKVMGLAPYGEPRFVELIRTELIDIKSDGSFRLNMAYFNYCTGLTMVNRRFEELFGMPVRKPESESLTQFHMDVAASIQQVLNECVVCLASALRKETGHDKLCLAGGVALNCVANSEVIRRAGFSEIWVQPAAGDAGGALGAALCAWYQLSGERQRNQVDGMSGTYLGPEFSNAEIREALDVSGAVYGYENEETLYARTASLIEGGNVVGWFQERMEFGPRALGHRSILGDPRRGEMQETMNLKIKFRESFRPFAPSVLLDDAKDWFECPQESPYMLLTAPVHPSRRLAEASNAVRGLELLKHARSEIPAVTHVDYSARLQTVGDQGSVRYRRLLEAFKSLSGCPVLINTSFNVRGEPIVATPEDAYRCFMATGMDYLVIGNYILEKTSQPNQEQYLDHINQFELD
ncbi:Nodulation protein nolO [Marinobacter nitratireducens]|uniref:Nodulation protein nolO n=1 Tax=Marinobacter nitratireducens TaxID=1137280 RepID=A0A072N405_9GAMM|nr:carbamoyltransferase [Marinobacter nitratireducens]KEF32241.1 Nodulation protein nolO [Marinobacter nitratireducens]